MSEILVTGGNGFVGRHLIGALHERGDRVRALVLPGEDARWLRTRGRRSSAATSACPTAWSRPCVTRTRSSTWLP